MVNSDIVATGLIWAYTIYSVSAISLFAWFAYRITKPNQKPILKPVLFYSFFALLIAIGVSLHIITMKTIPWVEVDINAKNMQPDRIVSLEVDSFSFYLVTDSSKVKLPAQSVVVKQGEKVLFDVYSSDLTYGFGLFRSNNSMITQMQVLPLYHNKLLWEFNEKGTFTLRSTEYSGPKGTKMIVPKFLIVK
ncbi:MAG: hypothetical protein Fur0028_11780 [Bacteroidales bacterium]